MWCWPICHVRINQTHVWTIHHMKENHTNEVIVTKQKAARHCEASSASVSQGSGRRRGSSVLPHFSRRVISLSVLPRSPVTQSRFLKSSTRSHRELFQTFCTLRTTHHFTIVSWTLHQEKHAWTDCGGFGYTVWWSDTYTMCSITELCDW